MLDNDNFVKYINSIFIENECDFENILASLKMDDKNKLLVDSHFYYHICLPDKDEVRSELRIVGITSLIEAMMQEFEFKTFFEYFESEYKGQNNIEDFKKIKDEYLSKYGATKKIRTYFDNYVIPEDREAFCNGIEKYNKNNFLESDEGKKLCEELRNCSNNGNLCRVLEIDNELKERDNSFIKISSEDNDLPNLLYQMRSDFVHRAEMRGFCSKSSSALLTPIGKESFNIEIEINTLLKIFERSFVKFWKNKAGL